MSVLKLTITENHIRLIKQLRWSMKDGSIISQAHDGEEYVPVFGENNIYEAIDIILNGKPPDVDPFTTEEETIYPDEQKAEWDKLYSELPMALDIILFNGHFQTGSYKTKFHDRFWKQIK
tara:strand:+ start:3358 stop:3717 length:360 start_codon:yes stop_codon:yes gene_type:complete